MARPAHVPSSDTPALGQGEARELASRLHLFAGARRLQVLWELAEGETRVKLIANRLRISTHQVAGQLRSLRRAGFVTTRDHEGEVFYRVADPELHGLLNAVRAYYEQVAATAKKAS